MAEVLAGFILAILCNRDCCSVSDPFSKIGFVIAGNSVALNSILFKLLKAIPRTSLLVSAIPFSKMYANFDIFISAKELIKAAFTFELVCFSNSAISFSVNAFNCNSATNLAVAINTSGFSEAKNPGILG